MAMSKAQTLSMLRRMRAVLESSTNKAIISNIIRQLENDVGDDPVALAIHEARVELKGSDADKDDPNIEEALDILREAVRESRQETASKNSSVGRSQEAMDARDKKNEIAELEARKQKVKDMLLLHASKDANLTETENLTLENELLKKEANIDQLIASKKSELAQIKNKEENKKMNDNNIVLNAQVKMSKEDTTRTMIRAIGKVVMAHKGVVKQLNEAEEAVLLKFNSPARIESFTSGKIRVTASAINAVPKFDFDTVTTTSDIFIPAELGVLGQNNGGLAIPTNLFYDYLRIESFESEFFKDVSKISYAGKPEWIYSPGNSGADVYAEYDCADPQSIEFDILQLAITTIHKYLRVSFELEKMVVEEFMRFLLTEIRQAVDTLKSNLALYGAGPSATSTEKGGTVTRKRPQPWGATRVEGGAIIKKLGTDAGFEDVEKSIENAPLALYAKNPEALDGAKFYMSFKAYWSFFNSRNAVTGERNFDIIRPLTQFGSEVQFPLVIDKKLRGMDILFGNAKRYKWQDISPVEIFNDKDARCRVSEYSAITMVAGGGLKDSFIYVTDAATPRSYIPQNVDDFRTKTNFRGKNA